jgi:hypothetical protein
LGVFTDPGCSAAVSDVCLQHVSTGCNPGGIVCESFAPTNKTIIDFYSAGCGPLTKLVDPLDGPNQCAHTQTGGRRFWVVSHGAVELVKPATGTVSSIALPFTAVMAAPNLVSGDTAYVVGVNGAAEVDNDGNVLRSETGLSQITPHVPGSDNIFVPAASPQICGACL